MASQDLTPKQQAFVRKYLETGNASFAYRSAYDVASDCKPNTIEKRACELLKNGKVAGRIGVLRKKLEEREVLSLEEHMRELKRLRDLACDGGAYAPAIKAEELRGKLCGFYVDRSEVGGPGDFAAMEQEELLRSLQEDMVEFGPALLQSLPPEAKKKANRVKGNGTQH